MTPRERDPAVWAAAYGAAFHEEYRRYYTASNAPDPRERHEEALFFAGRFTSTHTEIADAAVMALHPEDTHASPNGTVSGGGR